MKILYIAIFLSLFSCNKVDQFSESPEMNASLVEVISEDAVSKMESPPPPPPSEQKPVAPKKIDTISKKLIKNGEMGIAVGNINQTKKQIDQLIKNNKAYVQSEVFRNTETSENLEILIRVPHQNFDALVNSFSNGIGAVDYKNISTNDVTEEYTDVSIKLANKKIYLEKYRDLLSKASSTKDMLEIQENIRNLEDEIDVAEGRLRFIDDRVNYSSLKLNLFKEKPRTSVTSKIGFGSRFIDSVAEGWNSFVSFLLGLVSFWPFFLLIPLVIFLFKKWKGRKKNQT